MRASPAPAKRAARQETSGAAAATCEISSPGTYTYTRFGYCVAGVNVVYILRDTNGKEIGRGTLEVSTSATLQKNATTWDEQITVRMTSARDAVTALTAKFRSSCGTGCTATDDEPWYGGNLVVGQFHTGTVSYSSAPLPGATAEFTTAYRMYVTSPGVALVDPNAGWDNPAKIRCDDAVGGTSPAGCAVPSVMPVVPLKTTAGEPGGAVAAYEWAQRNQQGAWGLRGHPLTRLTSGVGGRTASTCGGFKQEPELVNGDRCGDFPFGETKEGGAPGAQCVRLIPSLGSGEWDTYILNDAHEHNPAAPCVQAHVTPDEKAFADDQLAEGFTDQRVIDRDAFELTISTPDTGPDIRCREDDKPASALSNGDGWFWNTTEPVPLVQQTVKELGAGERPTRALACVGRDTAKGTGTSGDITGWLDARAFRAAHPADSTLSRCHLVARILGGKGSTEITRFNLVPCWHSGLNTGTPSMRTFEFAAQNLIKGPEEAFGSSDALLYEVTPVYKNENSTIPIGVTMSATIQRANGTNEELFPNVYITNTVKNTGQFNLGN
ncbi:hypothetical protein [Streptomyces sp. NPDC007088]|uniref:hypothetical protein n=1 Tax=Streptomyces sp. NPDC007088 TaxID=3364773 RepID=UPI00367BC7C8